MLRLFLATLIVTILTACSSIKSIETPKAGTDTTDGVTYFMPKKDILIKIKIEKGNATEISIGTTPSYPDLSTQYVLRYSGNAFGKNTLNLSVSDSGLLSSAKSTTTSNVTDTFKNLVSSTGYLMQLMETPKTTNKKEECSDGNYTFIYPVTERIVSPPPCNVSIEIKKQENTTTIKPHSKEKMVEHSGVFYRQDIPYLITAKAPGGTAAEIIFSPSESEIHFLPISKTFFSNNEASFSFKDGIPNNYTQDTDGELAALFKLPADIVGAYFSAIGSLFNSFKTTDQKESEALTESLNLELAKKKYDSCISAIQRKDDDLINKLNCQ